MEFGLNAAQGGLVVRLSGPTRLYRIKLGGKHDEFWK